MEQSKDNDVVVEFPTFKIYKDGRIDRLSGQQTISPSPAAVTGVRSKDVVISTRPDISARLFLPQLPDPTRKLPLALLVHGGAFCTETPFSPRYHKVGTSLAADADVAMLSVHYRRPPESPLPAAFEDIWEALQWVGSHVDGAGSESWINKHVDFGRVFLVGFSAGATLVHFAARRAGLEGLRFRISGLVLVHPFFLNDERDKLIDLIYPNHGGLGEPRLYPGGDPELGRLGCGRVLVFVAEKDHLKDRGLGYYEALTKSEWSGEVEIVESPGEDHIFYLHKPDCANAIALMRKLASFLNQE